MEKEAAQMIADFSSFELEIREDYRGRGGGVTTGLVGDDPGIFNDALAAFLEAVGDGDQDPEDCLTIAPAVSHLQHDSMGLGVIWY